MRSLFASGLLGLLIGAVALAFALREVDPAALAAAFARAGLSTVVVAALLHVVVQALYAVRWRVLVGSFDHFGAGRAFGIVGLGYLANYTLPGRPGELVRAGLARGLAGVPLALGLASLLLEKVLDGGTILLSASAFGVFGALPEWLGASVLVGGGAFAIGGVFLLAASALSTPRGAGAEPRRGGRRKIIPRLNLPLFRVRERGPEGEGRGLAERALTGLQELVSESGEPVRNAARRWWAVVGLGACCWVAILVQLAVLSTGVGLPAEPAAWLLLYATLGLASVVPGAPGYVGTYQLAAVLALGAYGAERESAFAVATLYQLSRLLGSLVVGSWALSREGLSALRLYWRSTSMEIEPSRRHASSSPASERLPHSD